MPLAQQPRSIAADEPTVDRLEHVTGHACSHPRSAAITPAEPHLDILTSTEDIVAKRLLASVFPDEILLG